MTAYLTQVRLTSTPQRARFWLRFGHPARELAKHRWERLLYFAAHSVFCTVRWQGNAYGTILWQLSILRAVAPWERASILVDVDPGAEVLLRVASKAHVRQVLKLITRIEAQHIDPAVVSIAYWRCVQNRLMTRELIPEYGAQQHAAHLTFLRMLG